MANLDIGVVIGRFQVPKLHSGHQELLKFAKSGNDKLVILLGVGPRDGYSRENPLSFAQRVTMIRRSYKDDVDILPLFDRPTNSEWSTQIDTLLKNTYPHGDCVLYGGRQSFIESYEGKLKTQPVAQSPIVQDSGTSVRADIKEATQKAFCEGQVYALQQQFPTSYQTVDMALVRVKLIPKEHDVLLIQRADTGAWYFPGGFVDPTDSSLESAANREMYEECGVSSEQHPQYLGSFRINDWRYRSSRDKIMTSFFVGILAFGEVTPNRDEVQDFQWVKIVELPEWRAKISPTHLSLLESFMDYARLYVGEPSLKN